MRILTTAAVFALASTAVTAQEAATANAAPCATGTISYVFIDNHSIFDSNNVESRRFSWFYRTANALHVRTRRSLISRELLFGPGDCYDPVLAEESERLLRSYDFLAQVEVYGVPQPDGSYHVVVDTRDEWSTQLDVRLGLREGVRFEGARLREANLLGRGESVALYYIEREVTRDYGVSFRTPQFAKTRWDLEAELGRTRAGTTFSQSIAYPFVGELSRWSTRQQFSREDRYFDYVADDTGERQHVLVPLRDKHFDLAVVSRLGHRGNLTLLGAALTYQHLSYPGSPRTAQRDAINVAAPDDTVLVQPALDAREQLNNIRLALLIGQRNVWWVKRRGLDSMRGQQDVRLGAEVGAAIGRSLSALEDDDDLQSTFTLFTGLEFGNFIVSTRGRLDTRRDFDAPADRSEWEDVFGESELLTYWRPGELTRHTVVARAAASAGWNTRTPFQLTLGGDRSLRGYRPDRFPGGRRAVFSLEDRMYWGWPWRESIDVGSTAFVDVGRMWPGDAPYGHDSGWRTTVGVGLRASFPSGSRTTYRLDVALPVQPRPNMRDLRLMISVGELLGLSAPVSDYQLVRSRYEGVAGQLFRLRQ
jgi:hypothetical protein